jgi:hypothetical protein
MNERIRELIVAANDGLDGVKPGSQPMIDPSFNKFVEKFAELIVKECATFAMHSMDKEAMKKHFGVEE